MDPLHPCLVAADVIDAVRDRLAQIRVGEIVGVDFRRDAHWLPFLAGIGVGTDKFFLLGIHGNCGSSVFNCKLLKIWGFLASWDFLG